MSKELAESTVPTELKDLIHLKVDEDRLDIDLNELYAPNGKYTPEQKLFAVVCYMVEGNSVHAARHCGVPADTIRWWKNQSTWWDDTMRECRRKYQDQLDSKLTKVIHKGADEVIERIEHGDEVITKDGEAIRKKLSARDIATVAAIFFDKRALLRGDPTSNPGGSKGKEIEKLKQDFEKFAKDVRDTGALAKPVEGTHTISGASVLNYEESKDERKS